MFEDTVLKTVLISNTSCKFRWFPKPPSGSIIYWKGSQNSLKAIILMVTGYKERIQIKISQGKRVIQGSVWDSSKYKAFRMHDSLGINMAYCRHVIIWHCQPGKLTALQLVSRVFIGASLAKHG